MGAMPHQQQGFVVKTHTHARSLLPPLPKFCRKLRVLKTLKNGGQVVFSTNPATGKKGVSIVDIWGQM